MKIIICLDDLGGMLFNNRRISRDIKVIEDILFQTVHNSRLFIQKKSEILFKDHINDSRIIVDDSMMDHAGEDDYCFIEFLPVTDFIASSDQTVVYRWNRTYPSDVRFDADQFLSQWTVVSEEEFRGKSHEKITKSIYEKRREL